MARTKEITIDGVTYKLQSINLTSYTSLTDAYINPLNGRRNTAKYTDKLIQSCVVEPLEVGKKGLKYFDDTDDIATPLRLAKEIETFLTE